MSHARALQHGALRPTNLLHAGSLAAALALGLLAAIDPITGIAATISLVALVGFSHSGTFAIGAFAAASYFETVGDYAGSTALSPIKLTGGALVVVAAMSLVSRSRHRRGEVAPSWSAHPMLVGSLLAFALWAMASAAWAVDVAQVQSLSVRIVTCALAFLAIGVFLTRRSQFLVLAWVMLGSAFLSTALGLVSGTNLFGRAIGLFTDPNDFAAAVVPAMVLGFCVIEATAGTWQRWAGRVAIVTCGYGVLLSQSRGGLFALGVGALLVVMTARGRQRGRMVGAVLMLVAISMVFLALTPHGQVFMQRVQHGDSSGRTDLWKVAGKQFADNPVHGVGLGNYPVLSVRYLTPDVRHSELFIAAPRTTHNSVMEVAAELGSIGLLTFGTFVFGCLGLGIRGLRMARRLGDDRTVQIGRGVVAATGASLSTCIFLSGQYQEVLWVLLATSMAYHALVVRLGHRPPSDRDDGAIG